MQGSPTPRSLLADSKLSSAAQAAHRKPLGFLTRIPGTRKLVAQVISQALRGATWDPVVAAPRSQRLDLCHDGMAQRWLIVASEAAVHRAEHRVHRAQNRELATSQPPLCH